MLELRIFRTYEKFFGASEFSPRSLGARSASGGATSHEHEAEEAEYRIYTTTNSLPCLYTSIMRYTFYIHMHMEDGSGAVNQTLILQYCSKTYDYSH